ncbi:MAG: MucB/RseB C-terminal domain-containing protein [Nitrosomonas sp.]|nr:MucB/RseB C-terminal domain-containing protein [Nitrosomonas sp.]
MKRNLAEKTTLVDHITLSDGLAAVSVFIEPVTKDMLKHPYLVSFY